MSNNITVPIAGNQSFTNTRNIAGQLSDLSVADFSVATLNASTVITQSLNELGAYSSVPITVNSTFPSAAQLVSGYTYISSFNTAGIVLTLPTVAEIKAELLSRGVTVVAGLRLPVTLVQNQGTQTATLGGTTNNHILPANPLQLAPGVYSIHTVFETPIVIRTLVVTSA